MHRGMSEVSNAISGTWQVKNVGVGPKDYSCTGASADLGIILVGVYGGPVFLSADAGLTWKELDVPPRVSHFASFRGTSPGCGDSKPNPSFPSLTTAIFMYCLIY